MKPAIAPNVLKQHRVEARPRREARHDSLHRNRRVDREPRVDVARDGAQIPQDRHGVARRSRRERDAAAAERQEEPVALRRARRALPRQVLPRVEEHHALRAAVRGCRDGCRRRRRRSSRSAVPDAGPPADGQRRADGVAVREIVLGVRAGSRARPGRCPCARRATRPRRGARPRRADSPGSLGASACAPSASACAAPPASRPASFRPERKIPMMMLMPVVNGGMSVKPALVTRGSFSRRATSVSATSSLRSAVESPGTTSSKLKTPRGSKPGIDARELHEAHDEQAGADQQRHRERQLHCGEHVAEARVARDRRELRLRSVARARRTSRGAAPAAGRTARR